MSGILNHTGEFRLVGRQSSAFKLDEQRTSIRHHIGHTDDGEVELFRFKKKRHALQLKVEPPNVPGCPQVHRLPDGRQSHVFLIPGSEPGDKFRVTETGKQWNVDRKSFAGVQPLLAFRLVRRCAVAGVPGIPDNTGPTQRFHFGGSVFTKVLAKASH
jgi:hypothetical protein